MEISYPGRGTKHQKLQVTAVATAFELPDGTTAPTNGNASPKQPDGAVVADALPDATRFPIPSRVQGVVLEPDDGDD